MGPLVSIVMPAFNAGATIEESIRSIQKQEYDKWELLVVDDGSCDDTAAIVTRIMQTDSRVRLHSQENRGVAAARNTGMSSATGECVAFLDSDDLWLPDFLSSLLQAKEQSGAEAAYSGYSHLYNHGIRRGYRYQYPSGQILRDLLAGTVRIHICSMLVDRQLLKRYAIDMTEGCRIGEDAEFIMKVVTVAQVQAVPRELMVYRVRHGSTMHSKWQWQYHHPEWYKRAAQFVIANTDENSKEELNVLMQTQFALKLFKFLWRMVKYGYHDEVRRLLSELDVQKDLSFLEIEKLKIIDRLKYKAVVSQNNLAWRGASLLKRL